MSSSTTPLHRSGEFFRKTAFLHRSSLRTKFSTLAQISGWFARYLALSHLPLGLCSTSIVFSAKDCRSWHLLLCFFLYFSFLHFFSNTVFNCFDSTLPHSSGCFALYFGLLQSDLLILSFLFFFPFAALRLFFVGFFVLAERLAWNRLHYLFLYQVPSQGLLFIITAG